MSFMHPLARVVGKGSAKSGVHHWWMQRLTAIALIPLTIWFVGVMLGLTSGGAGISDFQEWMGDPWHAVLLLSWVVAMVYHGQLGIQVIIEDYIGHHGLEITLQIINKLVAVFAIFLTVVSIFKLVSGA